MPSRKPAYSGLRRWYPNPLTGGHVGVYRADETDVDVGDCRWAVVCETHGEILGDETFDVAVYDGRHPSEFCERCRAIEDDRAFCSRCACNGRDDVVATTYVEVDDQRGDYCDSCAGDVRDWARITGRAILADQQINSETEEV